ncbi:hypothetical protein LZ496_05775 [Sphingomonas sp. NSE70-1]|uniref:PilZ domain-containing protein n=1 Tax=Sphingomonas caseinilyticus TaxID=2908205 RepID=A0ABT0RTH3_9SPHN|nr:hypothetical protein [Sphingomonas caseinilyticus]MCL6698289.1 hypothetical protein [Sphingomonas caseinilyticus]
MARRKQRALEERFILVATIESVERNYFVSEEHDLRRVDDEASLIICGHITEIDRKHRRHNGLSIEMKFLCARSFQRDRDVPAADRPFLMSVNLRGDQRSLGAYLPADAFWELPSMIASGAVTHIEAQFGPTRQGHADLLFVNFTTATRLEADRQLLLSR